MGISDWSSDVCSSDLRALALEELLEVDGGQQVAADVGHAEHPRLRTGHGGDLRHRQDFDDLVETRRQPALADAVADAAPQARRVELLRQAGDMRQALALVLDEDRERIERPAGLAVDIGRRGVRLALVVAATAHRQPPSSSLMRAISAPSSGGLTL